MTMYVIEDDNGKVLDRIYYEFTNDVDRTMLFDEPIAPAEYAKRYGGHVIELVEKPKPVVVSEEEAEMLDALSDGELMPICELSYYVHHAESIPEKEAIKREDRLMRAYVNGWVVEKPKRWNVKVPQRWIGDDKHYWTKEQDGALTWAYLINKDYMIPSQQFTESEIEHYGLQDCERVEVCANNARTTGEVNA